MAGRYQVSLAHQGCPNIGFVVWEEQAARAAPIAVSLPRGFVSLPGDEGSVEILCSGCTQTIASAARSVPAEAGRGLAMDEPVPASAEVGSLAAPAIEAEVAAVLEAKEERASGSTNAPLPEADSVSGADPGIAPAPEVMAVEAAIAPTPEPAAADGDATPTPVAPMPDAPVADAPMPDALVTDATLTEAPLTSDQSVEALFADQPDVPPVRGDAIPDHLFDRLRHMARLRNRP